MQGVRPAARALPAPRAASRGHTARAAQAAAVATCARRGEGIRAPSTQPGRGTPRCHAASWHGLPWGQGAGSTCPPYLQRVSAAPRSPRWEPARPIRPVTGRGGTGSCRPPGTLGGRAERAAVRRAWPQCAGARIRVAWGEASPGPRSVSTKCREKKNSQRFSGDAWGGGTALSLVPNLPEQPAQGDREDKWLSPGPCPAGYPIPATKQGQSPAGCPSGPAQSRAVPMQSKMGT